MQRKRNNHDEQIEIDEANLNALKLELATALKLLQDVANTYFDNNACSKNDPQFEPYKAFYTAYVELYQELESQKETLESDANYQIEVMTAAKKLTTDTTALMTTLSKKPAASDDTYGLQKDQAQKAGAISIYKSKYQTESAAIPCLKTFGRLVASLCTAALGFALGGIGGAGLGCLLAIIPPSLPPAVIPFMIGGGVIGGIAGAIGGFCLTWLSDCWQQTTTIKELNTKAVTFANNASAFFPAPKVERHVKTAAIPAVTAKITI